MLEGMTKVLEILAQKVSRKASIIALAMVLIYLIAATPNVATAMAFIVPIAGLAVFFTFLQWILDVVWGRREKGKKKKKDDEVPEDAG
jgi:hypothetical protein